MDNDNIKCQLYVDLEEERQEEESDAAELSIAGPTLKSGERRSNRRSNSMKTTVTGGEDSSDSSCYIPIMKKSSKKVTFAYFNLPSKRKTNCLTEVRKELAKASPVSKSTVQSTRKR